MVNHDFEFLIACAALVVGLGMLWIVRSQPD